MPEVCHNQYSKILKSHHLYIKQSMWTTLSYSTVLTSDHLQLTLIIMGGNLPPPPILSFLNSREQNMVWGDPDAFWLFNPANFGHFKPFFKSIVISVQILWPFSSRQIRILPIKEKLSWHFFCENSRFWNGCRIHNFFWKWLGKVAMSQNSIVFGHGHEK